MKIIPSTKELVVLNMEAMSRGTGAKFLECLVTADEHGEHLIAYKWRRKLPLGIEPWHAIVQF